jgi:ATP phosphoribosyltransferase regulatory subunit
VGDLLHLDFSVVDDIHYYNGIVFKGFIHGLPAAVLSGGQYDRLMQKMGRRDRAIGFAVYMDMTERLVSPASDYDVDTVLLYDEHTDLAVLRQITASLSQDGSVLALRELPETLKYRKLMKLQGSEVAELENNP